MNVRRWAAWAPGLDSHEAWEEWARTPVPMRADESPAARFLPPMLRRRCTPLTRTVLTAAFACCDEAERAAVRTVFASRHGSINESIDMLEAIARRKGLSPLRFSHTVHNAQAGLFTMAAGNREASSSLSAQENTFACGWIEALTHLEREPERPVLLVIGDVPLHETFARLVDERQSCYALALLLARDGSGTPITIEPAGPHAPPAAEPQWPDALEYLRWLLSPEPALTLAHAPTAWTWRKPAET